MTTQRGSAPPPGLWSDSHILFFLPPPVSSHSHLLWYAWSREILPCSLALLFAFRIAKRRAKKKEKRKRMQKVDKPVRKVGNSVKNQGKQEYKLCVVCKKRKKKETCVLAKDETMGGKTGDGSFRSLTRARVISGSVLTRRVLHLVSANHSRSPHFHAQASNSDWPLFHAIYCATKKKREAKSIVLPSLCSTVGH